jgi:hypothetical protein
VCTSQGLVFLMLLSSFPLAWPLPSVVPHMGNTLIVTGACLVMENDRFTTTPQQVYNTPSHGMGSGVWATFPCEGCCTLVVMVLCKNQIPLVIVSGGARPLWGVGGLSLGLPKLMGLTRLVLGIHHFTVAKWLSG